MTLQSLLKAVRAWFYDPTRADYLEAVAEWEWQKSRFAAALLRGDTRRQGEIIPHLTKANSAVLRAERALSRPSRKAVGQ